VSFNLGQPMIVCTRTVTGTDSDGNDVYSEAQTTVSGAYAPGGSTELIQGRDTVTTQPIVYLPAGTVVNPADNIIVAGVRYLVDGSPNNWANPFTGWVPGVEVKLLVVTG
jgi:hypothetical protein